MFNIPTGMINPNQFLPGAPNPPMDYAPQPGDPGYRYPMVAPPFAGGPVNVDYRALPGAPNPPMDYAPQPGDPNYRFGGPVDPGPITMPGSPDPSLISQLRDLMRNGEGVTPLPDFSDPSRRRGPPPVELPTVGQPGGPAQLPPPPPKAGFPSPPVAPPSVTPPGNPVNTQPVQASDWFDYHDKKSKGINVLEPGKKGPTEGPAPETGTAGGPDVVAPDPTKPPLPDETGGVRKSDPVQATDWFDYHDKKSKGIDVLAPAQPTQPEPPTTSEPDQKNLGYGSDGKTRMPMPDGFTPPSSMAVSMGLETFYNPTTGEEWTASTGGYTPGPGWVKGSKATYKSDPAVDQPQPPVSTDPLSPLENLYGQIGVSDEAGARDVISKILSGQAGDLTQEQQGLTGSGIYRRIANRLGMRDADGNLITPLSSVKTESGSTATPTSTQALQRLLDMENAESGSGIQLLLNYLQGRMRPPPAMPQPQPGPFGLVPGRGRFGMPGMGGGMYGMPGMGGGGFGMPRPPMFGNPYMNRMPFMGYAGMPNFRNPNIFGGYGRGFGGFGGPGVMGSYMAPMSYYGRQRPRFGRMPMNMRHV